MYATKSGEVHTPSAGAADQVSRWLGANLVPGRIIHVGSDRRALPVGDGFQVTAVDRLAASLDYHELFDHAVVTGVGAQQPDLTALFRSLFTVVKDGGRLVVAVPFGTEGPHSLYFTALRGLIEPLFEVVKMDLVDGHVALVGQRRPAPEGVPVLAFDLAERAFREHERRLRERIREVKQQVIESGARHRGVVARLEKAQSDLQRTNRELHQLRGRIRKLRPLYVVPLSLYRRVKKARTTRQSTVVPIPQTAAATPAAGVTAIASAAPSSWMDSLRESFEEWLTAAREAEGDEVVLMFSGTTFVQEARANRPIRLTRVYLNRKCPVFFNYYRWRDTEPLPTHPDPLLFQSPIDATPKLLDALLTADFGGKKKIFYASFPHEVMVRYLTLAAQHGWVTVYDSRDDWEEFHKVGMAKWYHPGYERYVASQADVVSAVSRPLARKMSALAGGREVHVSANGLDPNFPRPRGVRKPNAQTTVGYFGHLTDKWFDWPLMIAAAQRYPEYVFELAGHGEPKLDLPRNIRLLGLMGHQDLADRSLTWSVALIPFKNSPLADAVDPIKIYEYLFLRLPVLATYFPQCRDYPGTIITEGRDEFLEMLPKLVGTELRGQEIDEWLVHNTWESRVDTYGRLADEVRRAGRTGLPALLEGTK